MFAKKSKKIFKKSIDKFFYRGYNAPMKSKGAMG